LVFFYYEQGKLDLALGDYNKAIALNPNYAKAYNNRGTLYKNQGKLNLALDDFRQEIALNPNYVFAYINLSALYWEMGNIEAAKTNLQKAQELFTAQGNTGGAEQMADFLQQLP
jgi:tetratricopeptide (TPR) repeat protein